MDFLEDDKWVFSQRQVLTGELSETLSVKRLLLPWLEETLGKVYWRGGNMA